MNCTKCGVGPAPYCPTCRWLLKLTTVRPFDIVALGLPAGNDYDERQRAEPIPNHKRPEQWFEVY